jgi:hypothetical protein
MWIASGAGRVLRTSQSRVGLALVVLGEALVISHLRPISDFSFPLLWFGYILTLDGALLAQRGRSLLSSVPRVFLAMFPVSAAFWWVFELLNHLVHSWQYVGAGMWSGLSYFVIASLDFSTVLPAVWLTALAIDSLLPPTAADPAAVQTAPPMLFAASILAGVLSILLPALFPSYAFGLVWICMFFLLDPVNAWLGRPSVLVRTWNRDFSLIIRFAPAALVCGLFWESWNFWAQPKWVYHVPHVGFLHVFEMPILGYSGYLPFGLELFAMATFVLPFLGLSPPALDLRDAEEEREAA